MEHANHDGFLFVKEIQNPVRETVNQSSTGFFANDGVEQGILLNQFHLRAHLTKKLSAETLPLLFIPIVSVRLVRLSFRSDNQRRFHFAR